MKYRCGGKKNAFCVMVIVVVIKSITNSDSYGTTPHLCVTSSQSHFSFMQWNTSAIMTLILFLKIKMIIKLE